MRSWKRPVAAIAGITIAVDLSMVLTDMGPDLRACHRALRARSVSGCGSSPT